MRFVKASPSEFLVVTSRGKATNRGVAASAFVWPGGSWVTVPATNQEASFEMTQETRDGLPLRFKGIVLYHVEDPVQASRAFDFTAGTALMQLQSMLSHICLGELRSAVAHLTMQECVEQRKTTLTDAVRKALADTVGGGGHRWGIALDVVQVAQVFIVDAALRHQLEADVRGQIRAASERATLEADEKVAMARLAAREPVEIADLQAKKRLVRERLELLEAERAVREAELEIELARDRAAAELERTLLPLRQRPEIARALGQALSGMRVSVSDAASPLVSALNPIADTLADLIGQLRGADRGDGGSDAR
jgi:regulator of protease activity HflC (stomatin/prohibitin superfamily)